MSWEVLACIYVFLRLVVDAPARLTQVTRLAPLVLVFQESKVCIGASGIREGYKVSGVPLGFTLLMCSWFGLPYCSCRGLRSSEAGVAPAHEAWGFDLGF